MARLRDEDTGETLPLAGRALVGRAPTCFLRRSEVAVSKEHALLQWSGEAWTLRDLGSRNGTYLDGRRLEVGATHVLQEGQRMAFGDPQRALRIIDLGPPIAMAMELGTRTIVEAEGGLLALPDHASPELQVYEGEAGRWLKELQDEVSPVEDQAVVYLEQQAWCLFLPSDLSATPLVRAARTLGGVTLRFEVSRDEEHVVLSMVGAEHETRLESREHAYVLLTLARLRAKDASRGVSERGWVDKRELQHMLRMSNNALNVAIHRARQQLADAGLVGAAGVVEVRRGQRRFGTDRFEIRTLED